MSTWLSSPWIQTPWCLLLCWLLLRLVPGAPGRSRDRWRTVVDLPLLVAAGLVSAGLCGVWLSAFFLDDAVIIGSPDFLEYCGSTAALAEGRPGEFSRNRTLLAAWPSALLMRGVGVVDGLLGSAMLSTALLAGAVGLWARAAHSRGAAVVAALAVGSVAPLCVLSRTLTYYPPVIAVLVVAAATGAAALRWRTAAACALAGLGAGLALLVDARGLPWALVTVSLGAAAALRGPAPRWRWRIGSVVGAAGRLAVLAAPIWVSFQLGPRAYPEGARTLEDHIHTVQDLRKMGYLVERSESAPRRDEGFVWGQSPLSQIPSTLRFVIADGQIVPEQLRSAKHVVDHRRKRIDPWRGVVAGAVLALLVGIRRRPLALAGAVAAAVPFVLALDSAVVVKQSHPRFLANALPFLPVLLGVAAAKLAGLERGGWRSWAAAVLALLLVLGAVPSWISPVASWRHPVETSHRAVVRARMAATGGGTVQNRAEWSCAQAIRRGSADGVWADSLR